MSRPCDPPARRRVGFLNTHPIQYFAPLYAFLNRSDDIEPVALYLSDYSLRDAVDPQFGRTVRWDVDLLSGYESHFVGKDWQRATPHGFFGLMGDGIEAALRSLALDALVVFGHNSVACLRAMVAARRQGIPVLYKSDSNIRLYRHRSAHLRNAVIKPLFARIDGFLASGRLNHAYYRWLGVEESRLFPFPFAVDNARIQAAARLDPDERRAVRDQWQVPDERPVVVFAAKLTARKRAGDLLEAAKMLHQGGATCHVLVIGSGEQEAALRQQAAQHGMPPVTFAGFRNQTELPRHLGASDVFVHPAEAEPYGLSINEAMCAGLPVVATHDTGSAADLVDGANGCLYPAGDVHALAAALRPLILDPARRAAAGRASLDRIDRWSFAEDLAGLRAALARVTR